LDRFNSLIRGTDETTVMFASRLESLFNYYLEARNVDDLSDLGELIIHDRVKSTLSVPWHACVTFYLSSPLKKMGGWVCVEPLSINISALMCSRVLMP